MASAKPAIIVHWFRRDLRLEDNTAFSAALSTAGKYGASVLPVFIFDTNILSQLKTRKDARVEFIHQTLESMRDDLREQGSDLLVEYGEPLAVWKKLVEKYNLESVYTNHDYEPAAVERDNSVAKFLKSHGIELVTFKDQVIFEKKEVAKDDGGTYTVFTPYSKKWKSLLKPDDLVARACKRYFTNLLKWRGEGVPSLGKIGFKPAGLAFPPRKVFQKIIRDYAKERDYPALPGTTHLGLHLRFGTVSPRFLVKAAREMGGKNAGQGPEVWLGELIWREFFMQILWHHPHVVRGPFRPEYAKIQYRNDDKDFKKWCEGRTGYPIVDAGMRELNATGFMHNRVRMITASFLVKHLLIDWRWGENYFAEKLLDFELSANNGNWQWVAGTGCDAAPYFRVFNPVIQFKKFDPQGVYVRHWVPEYGTSEYLEPMVDHVFARERVLKAYKTALGD